MSWATGNAAPMSISYTANDAGGSLWAYDFAVLFDNNDGTWIAGQQFDYLTLATSSRKRGNTVRSVTGRGLRRQRSLRPTCNGNFQGPDP